MGLDVLVQLPGALAIWQPPPLDEVLRGGLRRGLPWFWGPLLLQSHIYDPLHLQSVLRSDQKSEAPPLDEAPWGAVRGAALALRGLAASISHPPRSPPARTCTGCSQRPMAAIIQLILGHLMRYSVGGCAGGCPGSGGLAASTSHPPPSPPALTRMHCPQGYRPIAAQVTRRGTVWTPALAVSLSLRVLAAAASCLSPC